MTSFLLSFLTARYASGPLEAFVAERPCDWLVWEPGHWKPPSQAGQTVVALTPRPDRASGEALAIALVRSKGRPHLSLGRSQENDITIDDATLSRVHLVFMKDGAGWTVRDGGSSNGTWLDRVPLEPGKPGALTPGAQIKAASVRLTFYDGKGMWFRLRGVV